MALFTFWEIVQAVILTVIVGWIFKDVFAPQRGHSPDDYLKHARQKTLGRDAWLFAALLVAPSIILHELGHKFVALAFGLSATFNAAWTWLVIGVVMKFIGGFIFFVPAYVSISGVPTFGDPNLVYALAALAGPAINFALWGIAKIAPDIRRKITKKRLSQKELIYWGLFAKINLFLGIFNLIPLPFFDGFQVIRNILAIFTG